MKEHIQFRPMRRGGRFVVAMTLFAAPALGAQSARAPISRSERLSTDTIALSFDAAIQRALRDGEEVRAATTAVEIADAQIGVSRSTG